MIDANIYKKYNPLSKIIIKHCPRYLEFLTDIDCYLHRDFIFEKAITFGYNIVMEITPSTKEGLYNIDFENLYKRGYSRAK